MKHGYDYLRATIEELLEKDNQDLDLGLPNGRMGIAILLFEFEDITGEQKYGDKALSIVSSIIEVLNTDTLLGCSNGLSGVGIGILYLIKECYIEANADYLLEDIDNKICEVIHNRDLYLPNRSQEICDIGFYLVKRIQGRNESDSLAILQIKEHLIYLVEWIDEFVMLCDNDFSCFISLMLEIQKIHIHKMKVEKILMRLL